MEAKNQTPGLLAVNPLQLNHICAADASRLVAVVTVDHDYPQEAIDTAARMVKCWNTHDELVAVMATAANFLEAGGDPTAAAASLRATLAKVSA